MSSKYKSVEIEDSEQLIHYYKWCISFYTSDNAGDSSKWIMPLYMESLTKINDYEHANLPVMIMRVRMKLSDVIQLKSWEKKCLCGVDCTLHDMLLNKETRQYDEIGSSILLSETYAAIFDEKTFKLKYNDADIEEREDNDKSSNYKAHSDDQIDQVTVSFTLVHVTAQNALKAMFNEVFVPGTDVGTVLGYILSQINVNAIIADVPDNEAVFSGNEIIIPPMESIQAIQHLQSVYGIYTSGLLIFYDVCKIGNTSSGILYVLNRYNSSHDVVKDTSSLTYLQIEDARDNDGLIVRHMINSDKDAEYVGAIPIIKTSNEVVDGELTGQSLVFSSFNQGIDSTVFTDQKVDSDSHSTAAALKRNSDTSEVTGTRIITDYDELNNIYNESSYFNAIEATSQRFTISLDNSVVTDFMPNMFVNLAFDDVQKHADFAGNYFINKASFQFTRISSADYLIAATKDESNDDKHYTVTSCRSIIDVSRRNPDTKDS